MAKRGPKPKPTALKVLAGNPGHRPLPQNEPKPDLGLPQCPTRFKGTARTTWNSIAKQLDACGVSTKLDGVGFEMLVTLYMQFVQASKEVGRTGPVWIEAGRQGDPSLQFTKSPHWIVQMKSGQQLLALLREYGMTPSARATIKTAVPMASQQDPASRYFA